MQSNLLLRLDMKIPYEIQCTLEISMRIAIKKHWESRREAYWRSLLKREIAALRYIIK
jgi:hypothetical protein